MGTEAEGESGADYSTVGTGIPAPARQSRAARIAAAFGGRATPAPGGGDSEETEGEQDGAGPSLRVGSQSVGRGGRKPRFAVTESVAKINITAARAAAKSTIFPVNAAVGMAFGDDAKLEKEESDLIIEPLANIYMRNAGVADKVSRYSDPITLILALCVWAMRIYYLLLARQAQAQQMAAQYYPQYDAQAAAPAPEPDAGRVVFSGPTIPAANGSRPDYVPPSVLNTQFAGLSDLERMAAGR